MENKWCKTKQHCDRTTEAIYVEKGHSQHVLFPLNRSENTLLYLPLMVGYEGGLGCVLGCQGVYWGTCNVKAVSGHSKAGAGMCGKRCGYPFFSRGESR